jgi:phosphonate transport system substrate-binding protein
VSNVLLQLIRPLRNPTHPRYCVLLIALAWTGTGAAEPAAVTKDTPVLEIAVAPFLPAHLLVKNYQPMRAYLEQHLQQPVAFITAPDYKTFYERTQRRDYAVIITVAHAAYLAYAEAGYVPMLLPVNTTQPVLIVTADSTLQQPRDLLGKVVALPDPLAIISMQGIEMLQETGLDPDKTVSLRYFPNHSAAVNYVIAGEVAASIVSDRALLQMPDTTRQQVRIIHHRTKGAAPGVVYLASPDLPPQRIAQLRQTIMKFVRETPEGIEFITALGYGGLAPATAEDMKPLAAYGAMFKKVLSQQSAQ